MLIHFCDRYFMSARAISFICLFCIHVLFAAGNPPRVKHLPLATGHIDQLADTAVSNSTVPEVVTVILISPQPGAQLNYTQIMFEHPQIIGASEYIIEVALDEPTEPFKHPSAQQRDSSTAVMLGNFEFGKKYVWRYAGLQNGKMMDWNGPYTFEILTNPFVNTDLFRVKVLQNDSVQNAGGFIVMDISGNIIDRRGNFVWFMPWPKDAYTKESMQSIIDRHNVDMYVTPEGTITSISSHKAQERDLQGNILWQAPKRSALYLDSLKSGAPYNYHHCFKRTSNGHYMVLDMEYLTSPDSVTLGTHLAFDGTTVKDTTKVIIPYDIIKEFDRNGNLVWSWRAVNYFNDLQQEMSQQHKPGTPPVKLQRDGHINAFEADEKDGAVYAGFRNMNRVIKIDKLTGKVICSWGDSMHYRGAKNGDGFFLKQHGATLMHDGSVAVFNNNPKANLTKSETAVSEVVVFTQPHNNTPSRIEWKFDCKLDTANNMGAVSGNADELPNGNMLVCMGAVNRVFEVTRNKQVVWNALLENYNTLDSTWHKFPLYRAHYTSSLYPCYFTVQTQTRLLTDGQAVSVLKIFNDGSEDDSYTVSFSCATGEIKRETATTTLKAHHSATIELPSVKGQLTVSVRSIINPDIVRVVSVQR